MDAIAAGPPFDASPPHEESPKKVGAGADFESHGIAAIALGQLDRVGQVGDYVSARYAAFSGHAVNRITALLPRREQDRDRSRNRRGIADGRELSGFLVDAKDGDGG